MAADRPQTYEDVERCVDDTLARVGKRVVLGTPLGLGKANHLVNAFYRRAKSDRSISLRIVTALSLAKPRPSGGLEQRLMEPIVDRLFGDYPDLSYVLDLEQGELPDNVELREFYFSPGSRLGSGPAQHGYVSSNYTHAARDILDAGLNVVAQLVAEEEVDGRRWLSLSCNPDLTLELLPALREQARAGKKVALLAQVNRRLPFMYGDAMVEPSAFDAVVDHPRYEHELFGTPNEAVSVQDYAIALHASALVRDGGTLQLGIGSLGDAIACMLELRHRDNDRYRRLIDESGACATSGDEIDRIGGQAPFEKGLFAASEMLVDCFLDLRKAGVLVREVVDDAAVQRLIDDGRIGMTPDADALRLLRDEGAVPARLGPADVARLVRIGLLQGVSLDGETLGLPDGTRVAADLSDDRTLAALARSGLGRRLRGAFAHAAFFLGPLGFYETLRQMPREERERIRMTGVGFVNQLYGDEVLKVAQRRHARFINTGMMATISGAVVSDGLENGQVVSGVGGQYNFVAMAHALPEARSILMVRATREKSGEVASNIVARYGHVTIARHLRDIVVTEYGIADLRGRSDAEVAAAMIQIADSRFQEELADDARRNKKLPSSWRVPDRFRENSPERLARMLAPHREDGLFGEFPYGTDLSPIELTLAKALRALRRRLDARRFELPPMHELPKIVRAPESARPYLERMGLAEPEGFEEQLLQRVVLYALATHGAL